MKYYYFNKLVTLISEIREFNLALVKLEDGQELYVNSKLLTDEQSNNKNIIIKI